MNNNKKTTADTETKDKTPNTQFGEQWNDVRNEPTEIMEILFVKIHQVGYFNR